MTVSYTSEVATSRIFGCFYKLLARWKGSIYKLVWADLVIYIIVYFALNLTYRFILKPNEKWYFETAVQYCSKYITLIPLSFILGFYVNIVMTRWWNQYTTIPYPDNLALRVSSAVKSEDEQGRIIRRTIVRYASLCLAVTLTLISPKVKKRFPTLHHLVEAGLLLENERKIMEELRKEYPTYPHFWLPLAWASNVATSARNDGHIQSDSLLSGILQEIDRYKNGCRMLLCFDWISIPLVYTQVVTIAVYTYFFTSVIGRQCINTEEIVDLYFPILSILEFFFYMGWLRVAETLINPFGEDDDDFDVVWMIDRHLQVSYLIVDKIHDKHPDLLRDLYWHSMVPQELPHTIASEQYRDDMPQNSTSTLKVSSHDAEILPPRSRRGTASSLHSAHPKRASLLQRLLSQEKNVPARTSIPLLNIIQAGSSQQQQASGVYEAASTNSLLAEKEVIDFEKLKKLRQLMLQQKIQKYMEYMKQNTIEEGNVPSADGTLQVNKFS